MILKRFLALLGAVMIMVCSLSMNVYAEDTEDTIVIDTESNTQHSSLSSLAETITEIGETTASGTYNKPVSVNGTTYYVNTEMYNRIKSRVQDAEASDTETDDNSVEAAKQSVQRMSAGLNIGADTATGALVLSGLVPFIETALGVAVYIVTAGMTVFTVCDLCYIYIPLFREKTSEMAQSGNAMMSKTSKETGESKFRFVTDEAIYAVQTCSVDTGKHPASVWIKKRIWAYILLGIALFILLTGNITLIVNIVLNIVGGIAGALQGFGA